MDLASAPQTVLLSRAPIDLRTVLRDMISKRIATGSLFLLAVLLFSGLPTRVFADTCAPSPVTARGEESRFVWLAKTKTRANWRAKVRAISDLGPDYANWARAENTEERCLTGPKGTVCIFTGTPCRP